MYKPATTDGLKAAIRQTVNEIPLKGRGGRWKTLEITYSSVSKLEGATLRTLFLKLSSHKNGIHIALYVCNKNYNKGFSCQFFRNIKCGRFFCPTLCNEHDKMIHFRCRLHITKKNEEQRPCAVATVLDLKQQSGV